MQRLDDGRVLVNLGKLAAGESGKFVDGLGLLDQRTSELIVVTPEPVADVSMREDSQASFVLRRLDNAWSLAHIRQDQESSTNIHARVFAAFPVAPRPSPLTMLQITNSPLEQN